MQDYIGLFFFCHPPERFSPEQMLKAGFVIVWIMKVSPKWKCIPPEDFISKPLPPVIE